MIAFPEDHRPTGCYDDEGTLLMLRVQSGDSEAFAELSAIYYERVAGAVTRLMGHDRQTEDLAQEVFLRVYRARKNYVVTARFSTWLYTIVKNVVLNARRTLARRRETTGESVSTAIEGGEHSSRRPATRDPLDRLLLDEARSEVQKAIAGLNPRQGTAISLYYFRGMDCATIARKIGASNRAVKSLLHRARANIRESLLPYARSGHPQVVQPAAGDPA